MYNKTFWADFGPARLQDNNIIIIITLYLYLYKHVHDSFKSRKTYYIHIKYIIYTLYIL